MLVFAERTADVDNILERLITSGVEAVAVHGGLDQRDREYAISSFKVRLTALHPVPPWRALPFPGRGCKVQCAGAARGEGRACRHGRG